MGSLLSAWLESMGGMLARRRRRPSARRCSNETMDAGLNNAVKDNDSRFPPEWRLSRSGRRQPEDGRDASGRQRRAARAASASSTCRRGSPARYCTKLLADGGADVVKVESPDGDPLRRWSASGAADPARGRRRAVQLPARLEAERRRRCSATTTDRVAARAARVGGRRHLVAGLSVAEQPDSPPARSSRAHPHLTVTAITPFGLEGPWSDKPATEFTLQAWSGGIVGLARGHGRTGRPCYVGGQIGEWLTGRVRRDRDPGRRRRRRRTRAASWSTCRCSRRWRCA